VALSMCRRLLISSLLPYTTLFRSIAIALGIVAVIAMVATAGPDLLPNVALVMYTGATSFPLLAIPLFILAGAIMNSSGISQRLRSEEHTSELQSRENLVCRLLLEK